VRRPWWVKLLVVVVLAAGLRFATTFPWLDTWTTLEAADWGMLAVAGGWNLLSLALKGWAWQLLLRAVAPVGFRTTQEATFVGAAVNSVGIAMSGEAARVHVLGKRDGIAPGAAVRSIVASRLVEAIALGVFLLGVVALTTTEHTLKLLGGGVLLLGGALALLRWLPWLRPGGGGAPALEGWSVARLAPAVGIDIASWGLQWASYHWSIAAAHTAVTPSLSCLALVLANVGGIFRLTPANIGVVQGAVVLALRPAGVAAPEALAAGVALQAVQVLPVLTIGLCLLGRSGFVALFRRRAPEPA
jgi:uncharacterized membrane protein YbhN (UPF0104 family)